MTETANEAQMQNPERLNFSRVQDCIWQMGRFVDEQLRKELGKQEADKLSKTIFDLHYELLMSMKGAYDNTAPFGKDMKKGIYFFAY